MKHHGNSFIDGFNQLASLYGAPLSGHYKNPSALPIDPSEKDYFTHHEIASSYFQVGLTQSTDAFEYLIDRGLSSETLTRFNIGYAPNKWHGLVDLISKDDLPKAVIAGLVIKKDGQQFFDRFRSRIMFPIMNKRNRIVAFGGRLITANPDSPKYLNSPETPLFKKGNFFYGMPQATPSIRTLDEVIVTEGYMDVVMLSQHGIENVVATLGTALTLQHVRILKQIAQRFVFCFDGDDAGRGAAEKTMMIFLSELTDIIEVCFCLIPEGEDPDSLVLSKGRENFITLIRQSLPFSEFLLTWLKQHHDMEKTEGCAAFLHEAKEMISKIVNAPILAELLTVKCSSSDLI